MEVLAKGPILDWTNNGKLHERFLEWKKKVSILCRGLVKAKADPEFVCLCIYQWSGERGQNILDKATIPANDRKKWEIHLRKVEEQCKPRGSKLVPATQYKELTQGDMELPEYIEKCRQVTDACGWPEDAKDMALRNTILLGLKNPKVYLKCLEEDQDSLTAERVIEIVTLLYNSDCQRSIMQTLSTATAATTAIQQGSTQIHKVQAKYQKDGKSMEWSNRDKMSKDKEHGETKRQSCFCCGAKPAHPRSQCPAKDVTCHKCGKKGHYKKCCKSKTGKQSTTGEPRRVQVHGLQAPQTGATANQISTRDPPQDYQMMFSPHVLQDNQHNVSPYPDFSYPKDLNQSIKRNQYYTKTIDEVSAELHGGKHFTLVDAKSGYWMVELDNESSLLTTFNTPWGKYKWLRLPFGLKVSADVFQERLNAVLKEVKGITGCIDDILMRGVDSKDHDVNLLQLVETARMNGIKFNPKKLQFKTTKCDFFGQIITPEGMKSEDKKVEAIKQMKVPKDKKALQSFQGMISYLKRYSAKLMRLFEPLRLLLREEMEWTWDSSHQDAFNAIKEELSRTPVLAYFDRKGELVIQTDASMKGLGAILLQEGKPVIYVSRTLTPAEERYSNIDRELLGVVFAMERLHSYVYEILATDPFKYKPQTQQPSNLWNSIVDHLHDVKNPAFSVTQRAVKDKFNLSKEKFIAKKKEQDKASGIDVEVTEIDMLLEEIINNEKYYELECKDKDESERQREARGILQCLQKVNEATKANYSLIVDLYHQAEFPDYTNFPIVDKLIHGCVSKESKRKLVAKGKNVSAKDCLELMRKYEVVEATMKKLQDSCDAHVDASYTRDPTQSHKRIGPRESSLSLSQMERTPVSGARKTFIPATSVQPRLQHVHSAWGFIQKIRAVNPMRSQVDTGAMESCMSISMLPQIRLSLRKLKPTDIIIHSTSGADLQNCGTTGIKVTCNNITTMARFYITKQECPFILALEFYTEFKLVTAAPVCIPQSISMKPYLIEAVHIPEESAVDYHNHKKKWKEHLPLGKVTSDTLEDLNQIFSNTFHGQVSPFEGEVSFKLSPDAKPIQLPPPAVPQSITPQLKKELDKMEQEEIKIACPETTEWVHNLVTVVEKNGTLRLCLDSRELIQESLRVSEVTRWRAVVELLPLLIV
ncbi:Retrovirus-related Pol polyprotein from transposon 17.6 [Stylophora pistillata]|uniref:Retrovirus-related Pol polyprotein from transposon 17.6 n=1 Tax=Stylophora pistillata TaxID=50429 RepID=A0A2B4RAW6_STYPI|nr:Retrovirus-related Pol polyprotein from transposon 17.6 [Stylophora pistillata]